MRQTSDTRLARAAKAKAPRDLAEARHRSLLRGRAALSALLSKRSAPPDGGRALAGALQLAETAAAALAGIPDTRELRQSDEALLAHDHTGAEDMFAMRLWHVVRQYRDGRELDPATASPAELLAAYAAEAGNFPPFSLPQPGESQGGEARMLG
jgi:aminopeptidase N